MQNRWNDDVAARCTGELALRAYTSRLLGGEPDLVLLGGGNTSLKLADSSGRQILYVKGTGVDLAHATTADFTPLRLEPARAMLQKAELDYAAMMRELADYIVTADAPKPSIETLLHAALPATYVEHTHADSVLAITNTEAGMALAERVFGELALVVPYRHSGFALAKICAETWAARATEKTIGIVLMHHGVVACGASARESYQNMLRLVELAEDYLAKNGTDTLPRLEAPIPGASQAIAIANLRREISRTAGYPLLLKHHNDPVATAFSRNPAIDALATQSPATPQHAVFARRVPMRGRDVSAFATGYAAYLRLIPDASERLDAAPRVVLDEELGLLAAGITPWHMDAAASSYRHTIEVMIRASAHDKYQGLPPRAMLEAELEYGGFEHHIAAGRAPEVALAGTVNLLAPSLGTLLQPIADTLLAAAGAVVAFGSPVPEADADPAYFTAGQFDPDQLAPVLINVIARFGGIDTVVCTATDVGLIEHTLPWLLLSPGAPRAVLVKQGDAAETDYSALSAKLKAQQIGVIEIDVSSYFSPLQLAQAIARAIAIPPTHRFPGTTSKP